MKTANRPGQITFTESVGKCPDDQAAEGGCRCSAYDTPAVLRAPSGRIPTARLRRGLALATAVMAGAAVISLGTGTGSASAEPAPSHAGWDGSRYWFMNSSGEWRWTSHRDIYLSRIGESGDSSGGSTAGGIRQGWDGSRYWFMNGSGEWRWTSHRDIYLSRIGESGSGDTSGDASSVTSPSSNGNIEAAVEFALAQVGKPFVTAGNGPDGYDCSGLVQQAYRHAGISLPRVANDQYGATTPISSDQLQRGDLLFWSDDGNAEDIHHVAIYLGGNRYVEAAHPGTNVRISTLGNWYYPTQLGRP